MWNKVPHNIIYLSTSSTLISFVKSHFFKLHVSIYITVLLNTYAKFLCVFALYWLHCLSHSNHYIIYFCTSSTLSFFWSNPTSLRYIYISIYITVLLYTYARFSCVFALYWLHCLLHSNHYIIYFWTSSTLNFFVKFHFFKLYISIYITVLLYTSARFSCVFASYWPHCLSHSYHSITLVVISSFAHFLILITSVYLTLYCIAALQICCIFHVIYMA